MYTYINYIYNNKFEVEWMDPSLHSELPANNGPE